MDLFYLCLSLLYCHVCFLQPCGHLLGKGNLLALLNVIYSCVCLFPIQCLGVGAVGVLIPDLCLNSQGFFS